MVDRLFVRGGLPLRTFYLDCTVYIYPYFFTDMTWWIVMETWKLTDFASENPRTVQTQMISHNPGGLF